MVGGGLGVLDGDFVAAATEADDVAFVLVAEEVEFAAGEVAFVLFEVLAVEVDDAVVGEFDEVVEAFGDAAGEGAGGVEGFAGELVLVFEFGDFLLFVVGLGEGRLFAEAEDEDGGETGADEGEEEGDDGPGGEGDGAAAEDDEGAENDEDNERENTHGRGRL